MNSMKRLAASMTGAVAIAALVGTSAFAESRHSDATNDRHEQRSERSSESRDHGRGESGSLRGIDTGRTQSDSSRNNGGYRNNDTYRRDMNDRANSAFRNTEASRSNSGYRNNDTYRNNETSRNGGYRNNETYRNNDGYRNNDSYRNNGGYRNNETYRNNGATRSESYRNHGRNGADSYRYERGNTSYRNGGYDRNSWYRNNRPAYDSRGRRNYSIGGRINRFLHEAGGYRIWVDGGRYPIWIPEARIGLFPRLRVGLSLNFGGYYDPLGYVEAYDYYNDGYGYSGAYSAGLLRGVVETVDYRRGTLVIRDETSGAFVTATIRDRRLESLRPGDFAEISGDWTRAGIFEGLRLENVDEARY